MCKASRVKRLGGDSVVCSDTGRKRRYGVKCGPCASHSYLWRAFSEGVIGQRARYQVVAMKLFWVVLTHGLLVSGRYIRDRREAGNETVEEPKIRGAFHFLMLCYLLLQNDSW